MTQLAQPEVSLLIPARNSAHALEGTVQEAHRYLQSRFGDSFEIVLIPNSPADNPDVQSMKLAGELAARFPQVRMCPHLGTGRGESGKGAALKTGFLASRGKLIFFTDADLPYELEFFDRALAKLRHGYHFVTGNRRLPESRFNLPVSLLKVAYSRHRLGLLFNRMARLLLPVIHATDTQAGIKAMTRDFARVAFELQECPGFFFDLEFFLASAGHGYPHVELPVTLRLNTEKSTVRVLRESMHAAYWLARIAFRFRAGAYGRAYGKRIGPVVSRYRDAHGATKFFLAARWKLTPYDVIASHLPPRGKILDLGCGHGLLALAAALRSPERKVTGVDHDEQRIRLARQAGSGVANLDFEPGTVLSPPQGDAFAGIAIIDVMHYFRPDDQRRIIEQSFRLLEGGGTLLVREVDPHGGMMSRWNRLYERIATGIGFTRSKESDLHFRDPEGWKAALREAGFSVTYRRCSSPLFADVLFVCERPAS